MPPVPAWLCFPASLSWHNGQGYFPKRKGTYLQQVVISCISLQSQMDSAQIAFIIVSWYCAGADVKMIQALFGNTIAFQSGYLFYIMVVIFVMVLFGWLLIVSSLAYLNLLGKMILLLFLFLFGSIHLDLLQKKSDYIEIPNIPQTNQILLDNAAQHRYSRQSIACLVKSISVLLKWIYGCCSCHDSSSFAVAEISNIFVMIKEAKLHPFVAYNWPYHYYITWLPLEFEFLHVK